MFDFSVKEEKLILNPKFRRDVKTKKVVKLSDTIHLVLKSVWFDLIRIGRKKVEYRRNTPYYVKRLKDKKFVTLHKGYSNETMTFKIDHVEESEKIFEIYLGERIK